MKREIIVCLFVLFFITALSCPAFAGDTTALQAKIDKAGAKWTAGDNPMSHLSKEKFAEYCNLEITVPEDVKIDPDDLILPDKMPAHLDWSNMNGQNFMTSIKDQHPCGTCATFSSLAAVEGLIKITMNNSFIQPDLSEEHTYACEGPLPYTFFHPMIYMKNSGAPDEACYPYSCEYTGDRPPCDTTCPDWQNRVFKITDYTFMMLPSPEKMKAALQDGPIVGGFQVFEDFQYYTGGVYEHVEGGILGGHGVAVVGYDDAGEYWICKNSWGPNWGEDGYFRIKWGSGLLGFGYQSVDIHVDAETLCAGNTPPVIDLLAKVNSEESLGEEDDLEISFAYEDLQANLAGGELWYSIDGATEVRFDTPLIELTGVEFFDKAPVVFAILGPFENGEHTLTISVKDICLESSNDLSINFTVGDLPADDDDDDDNSDDSGDEDSDDDQGGCGC